MDTIRSSDALPSGFEVESAEFVVVDPVAPPLHEHGGLKDNLRHRLDDVKRSVALTRSRVRSNVQSRVRNVRPMVTSSVSNVQQQLRGNPTKWAGIAAGAGLGIGLLGRWMRHRAKEHRIPTLVVIEAAC